MTFSDELRLRIYRKRLEEDPSLLKIKELKLSDEELLKLMNSTIISNAVDYNAFKYTLFFHLIFQPNSEKTERVLKQIRNIVANVDSLEKVEKLVVKFGILIGFKSKSYRSELFRYINTPMSLRSQHAGRKYISSYRFKDIFYFAYNLIERAKKNSNFPRF